MMPQQWLFSSYVNWPRDLLMTCADYQNGSISWVFCIRYFKFMLDCLVSYTSDARQCSKDRNGQKKKKRKWQRWRNGYGLGRPARAVFSRWEVDWKFYQGQKTVGSKCPTLPRTRPEFHLLHREQQNLRHIWKNLQELFCLFCLFL